MKQHWAIKKAGRHISRAILGILISYALLWAHPAPVNAKVAIFLVAIVAVAFDVGFTVAGFLIQKEEEKKK